MAGDARTRILPVFPSQGLSRALLCVYFFATFAQELPTTATALLLVRDLHLTPAQVTLYYATTFIPWTVKPAYGFVSDNLPILSRRRTPYVVACSVLGALAYVVMAGWARSLPSLLLWGVVVSVLTSFCEVVIDSMAVESVNRWLEQDEEVEAAAVVQSWCMAVRTLGSLAATALSVPLLLWLQPRVVVGLAALVAPFTLVSVAMVDEQPVDAHFFSRLGRVCSEKHSATRALRFYWRVARLLYMPIIFLFLYNAVPDSADVYSVYLMDAFGEFRAWELAAFKFVGLLGALLGTVAYWMWFTGLNLRRVFVYATTMSALAGATQILLATRSNSRLVGMSDQVFVPLDSAIVSFCTRVALMPGIVLAAQSCPEGVEATMYSLFSSTGHAAALLSSYLSGQMSDSLSIHHGHYGNVWLMILVCNACKFVPLLLLPWLPKSPLHSRLSRSKRSGALSCKNRGSCGIKSTVGAGSVRHPGCEYGMHGCDRGLVRGCGRGRGRGRGPGLEQGEAGIAESQQCLLVLARDEDNSDFGSDEGSEEFNPCDIEAVAHSDTDYDAAGDEQERQEVGAGGTGEDECAHAYAELRA